VESISEYQLPSITVCYEAFITKTYLRNKFQEYLKLEKKCSSMKENTTEHKDYHGNGSWTGNGKTCEQVYQHFKYGAIEKLDMHSIWDLFDDLDKVRCKLNSKVCNVIFVEDKMNKTKAEGDKYLNIEAVKTIHCFISIETRKCITVFTKLTNNWVDEKLFLLKNMVIILLDFAYPKDSRMEQEKKTCEFKYTQMI